LLWPSAQSAEEVSPCLHHLSALTEVLRAVVRGAHPVARRVRELALDDIRRSARFVQQRGRHHAEAVADVLIPVVAKPTQRGV
jgi:hypothetical protein